MKHNLTLAVVLSAFALAGAAYADNPSGSGSMGISAQVDPGVSLTFSTGASGLSMTGTGTSAGTLPFGTVNLFSTPATGVTRTTGGSGGTAYYDLATPFNVVANVSNFTSDDYTLNATLASSDSTNTWLIDSTDISDGTLKAIATHGTWASSASHTLHLRILVSTGQETISNTINFVAVAN